MPDSAFSAGSAVPGSDAHLPDKRQVAASFSRAAASYDAVAELQREVGESLLARLPTALSPRRWVDLGCGTGYFSRALGQRFGDAEGLGVDIAEGMLRYAGARGGARYFIGGDAERLPLRTQSCDLLFSSLAIQWCADLPAVLGEARRVLREGGVFAFSSLCVGTLGELRASWQAVDGFTHVNRFRAFADYQAHCAASGLELLELASEDRVLHFPDLRSLTHELKALGAHNLNPGRPDGLTGRARVRALIDAYERFRQPQGLPATYRVVQAILRKPLSL
ncbi:malonyl-ACP O-methyltransferase BioC [Pseudomonas panipatensis]|jgi:malonyl-CoA O-methyltransferase|uniref:Malonyl-[acyl-carrier protein] O-methyltransferase n=1 Tax=Pseudomonas panipatensis TaxID=428992 RepID=A0A1G8JBV9_9PSED|nr:malonyl-ACP O-methyltransferase BioC [Pseudomonas panipatensis]SDI28749.1 malonyl-CoA O-methyltransferase [Pseudomonas panipatensis]SMP50765.1 malonyl-CoA O-methyltransferase [Pseudomonas panipatensis]